MASLLKDLYSAAFYDRLSNALVVSVPKFDKGKFIKAVFIPEFKSKELKERMKHTSKVLHGFLPEDYPQSIELIKKQLHN